MKLIKQNSIIESTKKRKSTNIPIVKRDSKNSGDSSTKWWGTLGLGKRKIGIGEMGKRKSWDCGKKGEDII